MCRTSHIYFVVKVAFEIDTNIPVEDGCRGPFVTSVPVQCHYILPQSMIYIYNIYNI